VQLSRIVQSPRSSKQPETPGVDTQGSVVVVVLDVEVLVEVEVVVLVLLDVVVEVDVVNGTAAPQCASVQVGSISKASSVTRHVSDGSAQCDHGMTARSQSPSVAPQRGALGSTHRQPKKMVRSSTNPWNPWQRRPSGHVPPQVGNSAPSQAVLFSGAGGNVVGVVIAG